MNDCLEKESPQILHLWRSNSMVFREKRGRKELGESLLCSWTNGRAGSLLLMHAAIAADCMWKEEREEAEEVF